MAKNRHYSTMTDEERKEYHREYYKKNRERMLMLSKQSQKKNLKRIRERAKERRNENIEKYREYYRDYNAKFRSPEAQKRYEENKKKGHKNIGERDAAWHKAYRAKSGERKQHGAHKTKVGERKTKLGIVVVKHNGGTRIYSKDSYKKKREKEVENDR